MHARSLLVAFFLLFHSPSLSLSLERDETVKRMLEIFHMSIRKRASIVRKASKRAQNHLAGVKDKRDRKEKKSTTTAAIAKTKQNCHYACTTMQQT